MAPQEAVTRPSEIVVAWRDEAVKAGRKIECIAIAFETGRDGFWLERQSSICRAHQRNMRLNLPCRPNGNGKARGRTEWNSSSSS
jgi:hypothetical protein